MHEEMIKRCNIGHLSVKKSVVHAHDIMFWQLMSKQIADYVLSCTISLKYRDSNPNEPLHSHDIPDRSWQKVSSDVFTWNYQNYMVLVRAYSRYASYYKSITIIWKLKVPFSRLEIPEKLKTDGAAYCNFEPFQQFLKEWNISHAVLFPTYTSSNGLSEFFVKHAKRILQKAKDDNRNQHLSLLQYSNTSLKSCGLSPAQLLFSRRLGALLPLTNKQLAPEVVDSNCTGKMIESENKSKHHDTSARKVPGVSACSTRKELGTSKSYLCSLTIHIISRWCNIP